jgi:hypothetical protein
MLALGIGAVNTKRFDTDIPRKFFDVVSDMEIELQKFLGDHIYGRSDIWPHFQRMYEGYVAEPSQAHLRDGWRTAYAAVAFLGGKYDVARTQLEALDWQPTTNTLHGFGRDLSLMALEVAARTGSSAEAIRQGELNRTARGISECFAAYTRLLEDPATDERTRQFLRHRLASVKVERDLIAGEWVDFLPQQSNDLGWVSVVGTYRKRS